MCIRDRFWFLSIALIGSYLVFERSGVKFLPSLLGWLTPMIPYFWFMESRTGDWLYSLKWNIFGNLAGQWISDVTVPMEAQLIPRAVATTALVASLIGALFLVRRKPRGYPVHVLFVSFIALQGTIYGFSAYVVPYVFRSQLGRLFLDRLSAPDYYYLALLIGMGIRRLHGRSALSIEVALPRARLVPVIILLLVLANTATYPYVVGQYFSYHAPFVSQTDLADEIMFRYRGGTIVSSLVIVNYRLINRGIPYTNIVGSLYAPSNDRMEGYRWLLNHNATWIIADKNMTPIVESGLQDSVILPTPNAIVFSVNQTSLRSLLQA